MKLETRIKCIVLYYYKYSFYHHLRASSRFKHIDENGSMFIHIPKAAGTSIYKSLYSTLGGGHMKAEDYLKMYGCSKYFAYYKFTFVRNPFDRLLSAYNFLVNGGMNSFDKKIYDKYITKYSTFEDFVINGIQNDPNIIKLTHFIPQHEFITIDGEIAVNYIGKFENINKDFRYISNILGKSTELKIENTSNKSLNYKEFYTDEMKKVVEIIYQKDLLLFDYEF